MDQTKQRDILHQHRKNHLTAVSLVDFTDIIKITDIMIDVLAKGKKIMICGCGGSAADAQHFAAELVGRYERERYGLPAIALTTDTSILTAVGNDFGFDYVFTRQLQALGKPGDLLIAISTSGVSPSVVSAVKYARLTDMRIVGFTGQKGFDFAIKCDAAFVAESEITSTVQEVHGYVIHQICALIDRMYGCVSS